MSEIKNPYGWYADLRGLALEQGYIRIGEENEDPDVVLNQVPVFWDEAMTIPATQPIRTLAGYPDRSGSPGRLFVDGKYSMRVRNAQSVQVFYEASLGSVTDAAGQDYLVHWTYLLTPDVQQVIMGHAFDRAVSLPADLEGLVVLDCTDNPTSSFVCNMYMNGILFGTLTISNAGAVTIASAPQTTESGDIWTIVADDDATDLVDIFATFTLVTA